MSSTPDIKEELADRLKIEAPMQAVTAASARNREKDGAAAGIIA
jgi:hypothetical protein